jgi:hypothetical protein
MFVVVVANQATAQFSSRHQLFTELLSMYVHDGSVNYNQMRSDTLLTEYIDWLAEANPDTFPDEKEKLAFWINAYNAYTLKIICDNYPVESINDLHSGGLILGMVFKSTVWDRKFVVVNEKAMTLNAIEHEIVRPRFKDPRAHFALVCASKSCPPLRGEAYEGSTLNEQLDDQARRFLRNPFWNEFFREENRAELSKIFSWYDTDFGASDADVLKHVARFLPDSLGQQILADPPGWDISYKSYDWSLNGY